MNILFSFLSKIWSGLAISLTVGLTGLILIIIGGKLSFIHLVWIGYIFLILSVPLCIGALYHISRALRASSRFLPPGSLYDVGGYKMHILAEGSRTEKPIIIWVPGGHGQGIFLHHLHKDMSKETRSIIFDRAGSGWSETGAFPKRIDQEVRELKNLLDEAGEKGPFLLVGHSFGGLFSENFAHNFPKLVSGLVLLDPTPVWNMIFAGKFAFGKLYKEAFIYALMSLFGMKWKNGSADPEDEKLYNSLKEFRGVIQAEEAQSRDKLVTASALQTPCTEPFSMVAGPGSLGDIPILLLTPKPDIESLKNEYQQVFKLNDLQFENFYMGLQDSMLLKTRLSSNSRWEYTPDDTSHNFPYEVPEFVLQEVRSMLREITVK